MGWRRMETLQRRSRVAGRVKGLLTSILGQEEQHAHRSRPGRAWEV